MKILSQHLLFQYRYSGGMSLVFLLQPSAFCIPHGAFENPPQNLHGLDGESSKAHATAVSLVRL
jgi:hypothetical protein